MSRVMRKKARISYYEPEEPSFDEFVFCSSCGDYAYEYCCIHGPLLVIPDDEVPSPTGFPSFVPRAALTIPHVFLHLAPSIIPDAGIGVFSSLTLPRGIRFGPYRGLKTNEANSSYCWQIYDSRQKPSHVLDACDPNKSNWMRYVNCSRHYSEQNLVAFQYQGELYYRTIRVIPRFTELLVFYGSEFASELGVDLRRYHSPVYSETLVKYADEKPLDDPTQPTDGSTVNVNESKNTTTEELRPKLNIDSSCSHDSESNSLIIDLDSEEENEEGCKNILLEESSRRSTLDFNLDKENFDSNLMAEDSREFDDCNQSITKKPEYVAHANNTIINKDITHKNVCTICNVKFSTNSDYISHEIRIHNSNINYVACTMCDYKTLKPKNLRKHIARHRGTKMKCELCDFESIDSHSLKRHAKIHNKENTCNNEHKENQKEKPYACSLCSNKYCSERSLKSHINTHYEDINMCKFCDKRFTDLKRHMKTHSLESL